MNVPPLLVLFVSGWGPQTTGSHGVFAHLRKPFLGDLVSAYPLAAMHASAGMRLHDLYRLFGSVQADTEKPSLAALLEQRGLHDIRVADPDRFGLLCQQFDGGQAQSGKMRTDVFVPFPPGQSIQSGYLAMMKLLQAQVSSQLLSATGRVVFASFAGPWTASLYQSPSFLVQAAQETSQALQRLVDQAMDEGYRVLICADTNWLAHPGGEAVVLDDAQTLPVLLIHPNVEGLRGTRQDVAHERDIPVKASGTVTQFAPTVAALLGLAVPPGSPPPLFADLISRTL